MKTILFILLLLPFVMFSQSDSSASTKYLISYTYPEFPGGYRNMTHFLDSNFVYPKDEKERITGTVWVNFVIDSSGVVESVLVKKGLSLLIDAETKRVIELLPKFSTESTQGKEIAYTLPIKLSFEKQKVGSQQATTSFEYANNDTIDEVTIVISAEQIIENYDFPEQQGMSIIQIQVIDVCSSDAEFFGGEILMREFIMDNLVYPKDAIKKREEGIVYVEFTIKYDGSLTDIEVVKGVSISLNNEAVRLIKSMPNWVGAERGGELYESTFILPIKFRIKKS